MNFIDALAETVNRGFCTVLGTATAASELTYYISAPLIGGAQSPFTSLYAQNCPLDTPPNPIVSISGGQCPGVNYLVKVTYTTTPITPPGSPLTNVSQLGSQRMVLAPTLTAIQNESNNVWNLNFRQAGQPDFPVNVYNGGAFNGKANVKIDSVQITRQDGLPDTCGDPSGGGNGYQPGTNIYNNNVTYVNNEGTTVTIPVVLAFGYATLNIDGTVNIPVNANFSANPQFNANFNFNLNTGKVTPDFNHPAAPVASPCSDPGGYKPDPSIPDPPSSIPDFDPLPPSTPAPTERRRLLKGCIVTTTHLDGNETTLEQQDNPAIYIPATGYVQFLIQVGNSSAWTNDIAVKNLRAFIPCPWDAGAVEVKGTPRYGNQFTVTPVYVTRTFNPTYPPDS